MTCWPCPLRAAMSPRLPSGPSRLPNNTETPVKSRSLLDARGLQRCSMQREEAPMRLEEIRQLFRDEFVLIAVTKTDEETLEILEGDVLAHSPNRDEIMALLGRGLAWDIAVEWCGEHDDSRVVAI
jgi:hypothetical protein